MPSGYNVKAVPGKGDRLALRSSWQYRDGIQGREERRGPSTVHIRKVRILVAYTSDPDKTRIARDDKAGKESPAQYIMRKAFAEEKITQ